MQQSLTFSSDTTDFLYILSKHKVKYLIVGGEAVIYYGHARLTGDIDIFYERTENNVLSLFQSLNEFWENNIPGIKSKDELIAEGTILQFGVPPNRIDLLNSIENIDFQDAWRNKNDVEIKYSGVNLIIHFIGLKDLIRNKESLARHKDKEDLIFLKAMLNKKLGND